MSDSLLDRLKAELADRYTIVRELGQGGMATVYLARDIANDRDVAMKVLLPDLASVLGPERFKREIDVASQLQHPNILGIFESGAAAGTLYYTMPFIEGESLRTRLDRERQLSVNEALRIAGDVASALDLAHSKGIVHRDIKPENILLRTDGQVIVADFGIARAVSTAGDEKLTKTGMTLGTPTYMSPEQATAERVIDGRSDIYALGCVLYEMLAGTPPFTGPNAQAITARHIMDDAPAVSTIRRTVPMHVEQTIRVAMAKAPVDRFTKASEFVKALGDATGQTVLQYAAAIPTGGFTAPKIAAAGRGRSPVARVAMIALPVVLAGGGLAFWQLGGSAAGGAVGGGTVGPERVAVMYFQDKSGGDLEFLADGLTESLIQELSRVEGVDVVSTNGMLPFRGSTSVDSVAKKLGAGLVVLGSIEPQDEKLGVTLQLVNARGEPQRDPVRFALPATDLMAAREAVTMRATQMVLPQIGRNVALAESRAGTRSGAAWEHVQRAEHARKQGARLMEQGDHGGGDREFARADSLLQLAERADGRWTEPVVKRTALAYARASSAEDRSLMERFTREGIEHADRALATDPRNAEALQWRGTHRFLRFLSNLETDPRAQRLLFERAQQDLVDATTIAPQQAFAWYALSHVYAHIPDLVNSATAARRAYEADQFLERAPDILWRLHAIAYSLEQHAGAKRWCEEGRQRFPEDARFIRCQLWLMTMRGERPDPERAEQLVGELVQRTPPAHLEFSRREAQMILAAVLVRSDERKRAEALLVSSRGDAQVDPEGELMAYEAFVRTMMGQKDAAISILQRYLMENPAHREGFGGDAAWWWRDLQEDPRFRQLTGSGG